MITIDKNVPLRRVMKGGSSPKYPLGTMDVGDSFFAPGKGVGSMSGGFSHYKPKTFTSRTVTENGVKGVRVWRLS